MNIKEKLKKYWKWIVGLLIATVLATTLPINFGTPEAEADIIVSGTKIVFKNGQIIEALEDGTLLFTDKDATTSLKVIKDIKEKVDVLEDEVSDLKEKIPK